MFVREWNEASEIGKTPLKGKSIMFVALFFVVLVICTGHPMVSDESLFDEKTMQTLDDGVKFGWELVEEDDSVILMKIEMPKKLTWLTIGFHKDPFKWSSDEDLALIYVKNKGRFNEKVVLRTIHYTQDGDIKASYEHLYRMENKVEDDEMYRILLLREIQTLPVSSPIKLVWGHGSETYRHLAEVFSERMETKFITLDQPSSFITSSTVSTLKTPVSESPEVSYEITTQDASTMVDDDEDDSDMSKPTDSDKLSSSNDEYQKSYQMSSNLPTTTLTTQVNVDNKGTQQGLVESTPCPTPKCNCPTGKPAHWWEDLNNSVYMAIVGASALFTGLLVLCLACCCAKRTPRIAKTRKHKVAFYKVDDFESGEEEMEFLKNPKEEK